MKVDGDGLQAIIEEASRRAAAGGTYDKEDALAAGRELGLSEADVVEAWEAFARHEQRRANKLRLNRMMLLGVALFVILSIIGVGTWRAVAPAGPSTSSVSFAGSWDTNWGRLEIVDKEGTVRGRYSYDASGRKQAGLIKGVVRGTVLVATWEEQRPDGHHTGPLQLEMAPDGQSFRGAWGDGRPPDPDGAWTGTRLKGLAH